MKPNDSASGGEGGATGFAEAAVPFLPKPWVDLGPYPVRTTDLGIFLPTPLAPAADRTIAVPNSPDVAAKRLMDIIGGCLALVFFAPMMLLIALMLIIEGGPVLYRQVRLGRAGNRFSCLKFRTMRRNADAHLAEILAQSPSARKEWERHQKLAHDPRVTWFGRILRQSSLDELPQLINVLRGEMSLVGPRPIIAPDMPGYAGDRAYFLSPFFEEYCLCRPGITGLWQIGNRHNQDYAERLRQDRRYVRTWSLILDIKILWRTVGVVLRRTGA